MTASDDGILEGEEALACMEQRLSTPEGLREESKELAEVLATADIDPLTGAGQLQRYRSSG